MNDLGGGAGQFERLESKIAYVYRCDQVSRLCYVCIFQQLQCAPHHTHQEKEWPCQRRASILFGRAVVVSNSVAVAVGVSCDDLQWGQ